MFLLLVDSGILIKFKVLMEIHLSPLGEYLVVMLGDTDAQ